MSALQLDLLEPPPAAPEGFLHREALLSPEEEAALISWFGVLSFRNFEFHGYFGRRRTISFGLHYDFAAQGLRTADAIPDLLLPLRERAAVFAEIAPDTIQHALVTEYAPGAAIGWHRDRPVFDDVIGISFASSCRFRFRRPLRDPPPLAGERRVGAGRASGWERIAVDLAPRSVYLLRGPARWDWQHSIPPAEELRYSVTFRTERAI